MSDDLRPDELGLDSARLAHLDGFLAGYVERGLLPGFQVAVTRHGRLAHFTSHGLRDTEARPPVVA